MDNPFHDHLDNCRQCANNPFELCAEGAKLLDAAVAVDTSRSLPIAALLQRATAPAMRPVYLGDGAYCANEGDMLRIYADREGMTHEVFLEPDVAKQLLDVITAWLAPMGKLRPGSNRT